MKISGKHKSIIAMLCVMMLLFSGFTTTVSAATSPLLKTGVKGTAKSHKISGYHNSNFIGNAFYKFGIVRKSDGKEFVGFCINPHAGFKSGYAYTAKKPAASKRFTQLSKTAQTYIPQVLLFGWAPGKDDGVSGTDSDDYYVATQCLIWQFADGQRNKLSNKFQVGVSGSYYNTMKGKAAMKSYKRILKKMELYNKGPSFNGKKFKMKQQADESFTYTLTDANKLGLELVSAGSGNKVTKNTAGTSFTVTRTKDTAGKYVTLTFRMKEATGQPDNQAFLIWEGASYNQGIAYGASNDKTYTVKLIASDEQKEPSLKIIKKTNDGGPVSGFKFNVKGDNYDQTVTTDDKGIIVIDPIKAGKYTITEILTDEQKKRYETPQSKTVTVTDDEEETEFTFTNEAIENEGKIYKTAEDGNVEGITFNIEGTSIYGEKISDTFVTEKMADGEEVPEELIEDFGQEDEDDEKSGNTDDNEYSEVDENGNPVGSDVDEEDDGDSADLDIDDDEEDLDYSDDIDWSTVGSATVSLPYGTYTVTEVNPNPKLYADNEPQTITIDAEHREWALHFHNRYKRFGIKLSKIDNDLDEAYAQGGASLSRAEFSVTNRSEHSVTVDGKEYKNGEVAETLITGSKGTAATDERTFHFGTYEVKESKAPEGYLINEKWKKVVKVVDDEIYVDDKKIGAFVDGMMVDLSDDPVRENVIRGGVQIVKKDKELAKSEALGGANLNDIIFTIKNVSDHDVVVRKNPVNVTVNGKSFELNMLCDADVLKGAGTSELFKDMDAGTKIDWTSQKSKKDEFDKTIFRIASGSDVGYIVSHWNEEKKAYTAETFADDLPYGTYTIRESVTNNTYQRTDKEEKAFEITKDGELVWKTGDSDISFDNYVYRGDLQGTKIGDGDSDRFGYVPFKVTMKKTGESHVVVTDKNGLFKSVDRRTKDELEENELAATETKINPFDDLMEKGEITTAMIEARAQDINMPVWFSKGEFESDAEYNAALGALPYGDYTIEELACEKNKGYELQKFDFTIETKTNEVLKGLVDLETITNDKIPEEPEEPEPDNPSYEMYKIRTTKAPSKGDKYGFFAQDEVEYEVHVENTGNVVLTMDVKDKFTEGENYFTTPELKDAKFDGSGTWNNKGKDTHVANITINPGEKAVITYTAKVKDEAKEYLAAASMDSDSLDENGKDTNMAYQKNVTDDKDGYRNEASCENVTYPNPDNPDKPNTLEPKKDIAQTPVQKPEIGTTLTDKDGKKELLAGEKTVLVDTVSYKGLDTSKWYIMTGTLMVKDTGDPLVENGKEITVTSKPFKPKKPNGEVKITFEIDTTGLEGKELVAFEVAQRLEGYSEGDDVSKTKKTVVAEHKDINDKGQTVKVIKKSTPESPAKKTTTRSIPKTGDNFKLALYIFALLAAAGTLVMAIRGRNRLSSGEDGGDYEEETSDDAEQE